jgi:hypothetical protein
VNKLAASWQVLGYLVRGIAAYCRLGALALVKIWRA